MLHHVMLLLPAIPSSSLLIGSQNHRLNTTLQNFMFTMLRHDTEMAARKSLDVMIELWRRRVWTDAKTVNAMAQACFSHHTRVMASALHFFLGIEHYT